MRARRRETGPWPSRGRHRTGIVSLAAALLASLCGCMGVQRVRPLPRIERGGANLSHGDSVLRIAGGLGSFRLGTFDDDLSWGRGRAVQVGLGQLFGGGLRFMDFELSRPSGGEYHVETVLGYFGGGIIGGHPYGGGCYFGIGLGSADVEGPGASGDDFAFALAIGAAGYANTRDFAVGIVTEVGLFLAEPAGVDLDGVTFVAGVYVSY